MVQHSIKWPPQPQNWIWGFRFVTYTPKSSKSWMTILGLKQPWWLGDPFWESPIWNIWWPGCSRPLWTKYAASAESPAPKSTSSWATTVSPKAFTASFCITWMVCPEKSDPLLFAMENAETMLVHSYQMLLLVLSGYSIMDITDIYWYHHKSLTFKNGGGCLKASSFPPLALMTALRCGVDRWHTMPSLSDQIKPNQAIGLPSLRNL